ncbi:protein fantom [Aulostomus maculatus]
MSPVLDETAGDLPVKDVGLMRGGLMPAVPDNLRSTKPWKKHHLLKTKDPQRLFRAPREHLEDLCLRLQEENSALRQHTRSQEQRLRRMSNRLTRLRQARPGSGSVKERDMEDTIQELEARVATLESQKGTLQNKLSLAKQHIMDLGGRTPYKLSKGKSTEMEGGVRRATQTAPPRYGPSLEDTRAEMERFRCSVMEQVRVAELELTAQTLRDTLREREKEMEGTVKEMRRHQSDRHRLNIRENVDLIRLQKQLADKSTALRVSQEKFNDLQEAYENQLEETQRSLRESHGALLEKVEELTEQLKQERQRTLELEGQLSTATLSVHDLDKLQERIRDLEGERDLIKESYDTLLERTLSTHSVHDGLEDKHRDRRREEAEDSVCRMDVKILEEMLQAEREERGRMEQEREKLRQEKEKLEEREKESSMTTRDQQEHLQQEVLQYREQVSVLQGKLDSVSKAFDMSVEELSETLLQIKMFRLQQESSEGLSFLRADGKVTADSTNHELTNIQASHAETVLELQKTRNLLLLEHHISKDLQDELNTVNQKTEREREEVRMRMAEKDKLLSKRALQINTLQAQLKELAYSPRNYKRTIPIQYTWPAGDQEVVQSIEDDLPFSQLRAGESLMELHIKGATFTPGGLRSMGLIRPGGDRDGDIVTFCTYSFLDFEVHSTPLVSGSQPNYGFTSRYALTPTDLGRLGGQGSRVRVELHQALGGVRFATHGSGQMSLMGAMERRGERMTGHANITGAEGEIVGVVDFWTRLFPPAEPMDATMERTSGRSTATHRSPVQMSLGWRDGDQEETHDYGGGIPNELVLVLERCVGLSARWPGLLPDAYLTYRLYDLPPHVSQTVQCSADPVFNDTTSYPLAVTTDVLHYMRSSSLWVYVFDDSDDQIPPAYLAKTPIPLRTLATGREIRGDYVLRDPAGGPRGMVRVTIKWKYPFQAPVESQGRGVVQLAGVTGSAERREEAVMSQRPIAKPRVKMQQLEPRETKPVAKESKAWETPCDIRVKTGHALSFAIYQVLRGNALPTVTSNAVEEELSQRRQDSAAAEHSQAPGSASSSSSQSDIIVIPPQPKMRQGEKLRVEILSLTFEPSAHVVLDKSVQRVYVEYRLLGVPMETTETPMSLRKPTKGEEVHYNFTRVIYVDGSQSAPLRQYLYAMLEGRDPNQGRLKFTVVSEPMGEEDECVDVGHAFLDLQELLLTGNDVIERQIDIVSVDDEHEVIGHLKVSLEAAKALTGIYREYQQKTSTTTGEESDQEEEEARGQIEERKAQIKVTEYDGDSDF